MLLGKRAKCCSSFGNGREREREREDVNGSFHRQEKLLQLGNKYLEKLNLIFVYVKTPGVTVELDCLRPTNRFDFAY